MTALIIIHINSFGIYILHYLLHSRGAEEIRRVANLAIYELEILAGGHHQVYTAECSALN